MKKQFENWLAMFNAVLTVLAKFIAVWQSSNAFTDSSGKFKTNKAAIDLLRKKSESGSKSITEKKNDTGDKLVVQLLSVSKTLMAFFNKTGDTLSYHKVKTTKSELEKLRENQLISAAKDALELARANITALADYQITEPILTELETTLNDFEKLVTSPRITIGERKTAKQDLSVLFKESYLILTTQLDLMMVPYEKTNPDFYNEYMSARKVVQYGIRHEKGDDKGNKPDDTKSEDTKSEDTKSEDTKPE